MDQLVSLQLFFVMDSAIVYQLVIASRYYYFLSWYQLKTI